MAYNPSSLAHIRRQVSNLQVRFSLIVKKTNKIILKKKIKLEKDQTFLYIINKLISIIDSTAAI